MAQLSNMNADPREFIKKHSIPSVLNENQQNFILDNFPPVLYSGESFIIKNVSSSQIRNFIKEQKAKPRDAAAAKCTSGADEASMGKLGVKPEAVADAEAGVASDVHSRRQHHDGETEAEAGTEAEKIHEEVILSESVLRYILQKDLY
jgi:hypothetical protein